MTLAYKYFVGCKNTSCTKVFFCKKSRLYYCNIQHPSALGHHSAPVSPLLGHFLLSLASSLSGRQQRVSTGYCHENITCAPQGILYDFFLLQSKILFDKFDHQKKTFDTLILLIRQGLETF